MKLVINFDNMLHTYHAKIYYHDPMVDTAKLMIDQIKLFSLVGSNDLLLSDVH